MIDTLNTVLSPDQPPYNSAHLLRNRVLLLTSLMQYLRIGSGHPGHFVFGVLFGVVQGVLFLSGRHFVVGHQKLEAFVHLLSLVVDEKWK